MLFLLLKETDLKEDIGVTMENNLKIRNFEMEKDHLYLCGTIFEKNIEAIVAQAEEFLQQGADMLEIRGDAILRWGKRMPGFFSRWVKLSKAIDEVRKLAPDTPIIFSLRTKKEGGKFCGNKKSYNFMIEVTGFANVVDFIDVEMRDTSLEDVIFRDASEVYNGDNLIEYLTMYETPVILSRHILQNVPFAKRMEQAEEALKLQEQSDAAICKLAVYVENEDQLKEYQQLLHRHEKWMSRPHIGIAMGECGVVSRYDKGWCDSCISFAAGKKVAAPGQMSIEEIKKMCYNA